MCSAADQASASDVVVLSGNQREISPKVSVLVSDSCDSSQSSFTPETESSSEMSSSDESPKKKKKSKSRKNKKNNKKSKGASKKQGKGLRLVRRGNYCLCVLPYCLHCKAHRTIGHIFNNWPFFHI